MAGIVLTGQNLSVEWFAEGSLLCYNLDSAGSGQVLNLGEGLPYLITGKDTKRAIASAEEVLALKPELAAVG